MCARVLTACFTYSRKKRTEPCCGSSQCSRLPPPDHLVVEPAAVLWFEGLLRLHCEPGSRHALGRKPADGVGRSLAFRHRTKALQLGIGQEARRLIQRLQPVLAEPQRHYILEEN